MSDRIILHGTNDIKGMAMAAERALERESFKVGDILGIRIWGKVYSIKYTKTGVSVYTNEEPTP